MHSCRFFCPHSTTNFQNYIRFFVRRNLKNAYQTRKNANQHICYFKTYPGNNPMVGMTVAVAVAVSQALAKWDIAEFFSDWLHIKLQIAKDIKVDTSFENYLLWWVYLFYWLKEWWVCAKIRWIVKNLSRSRRYAIFIFKIARNATWEKPQSGTIGKAICSFTDMVIAQLRKVWKDSP